MGIGPFMQQFIQAIPLPKGFSVLELGFQQVHNGPGTPKTNAETFYRKMGCSHYECCDGNGKGSRTIDLNVPHKIGNFSIVTDLGTGEHIFNQAAVFQTLHDNTEKNGLILIARPLNGDHGFYGINPKLIYDHANANSYQIEHLFVKDYGIGPYVIAALRKPHLNPMVVPVDGLYKGKLKI